MAFGLSFGAKKSSSKGTSEIDKMETGWEKGIEQTLGTKTGITTQIGSGTTASQGSSATSQVTDNLSTSKGTQKVQTKTEQLDEATRSGLGGAITSLLTQILDPTTGDRSMILAGLDRMGGFDPEAYVSGTLSRAAATQGSQLDEILGSIFSKVGGSEGNNSASSLLAARARGDAASNLAGVEANAQATAAGIQQNNVKMIAEAVASGGASLLPQLAGILKGANTTSDQSSVMDQIEQLLGKTAGVTQTAETGQTTQNMSSTTVEDIAQTIAQLLEKSMHTTGTEKTTTKGKEMGGGFSLSF